MKRLLYIVLIFSFVPLCSRAQSSTQKEKPVIDEPVVRSGAMCMRTNTDTLDYSQHKDFKSAYSRIAKQQLSINFSKVFEKQFPMYNATDEVLSFVFQLRIDKNGALTDVFVLRSPLKEEDNDALIEIITEITDGTWQPAKYKGKTLDSEYTLPITIHISN